MLINRYTSLQFNFSILHPNNVCLSKLSIVCAFLLPKPFAFEKAFDVFHHRKDRGPRTRQEGIPICWVCTFVEFLTTSFSVCFKLCVIVNSLSFSDGLRSISAYEQDSFDWS